LGKLRIFSGRELTRLLSQHGFQQVPMHHEIRIGTLQSIIRQTGLPRELFEVG
jgi:predicted RNA binding protein YcfA (HicA-like mRNA interferase family)